MKFKRIFAVLMAVMLMVPSLAFADSKDEAKTPVQTPAADLRADLSSLLSAHFEYQVLTAIKTYQDAPDADVAREMLEKNADEMTAAIESLYGEEGAKQFADILSSQYEDSTQLGQALKDGDTTEASQALTEDFPKEFGAFLGTATEGNLPAETATEVLMAHEQDVIDVATSYVNGNYEEAYNQFDEGFERMYTIGTALSDAIVKQMPEKFNDTKAVTPAADLRMTFNQLLGVHFGYQTLTSLKQTQGADDAEIVTEKLEENAMDMKAAVSSIYGEEGAQQFADIFASQYKDSADLGMAMMNEDMDKADAAKQSLTQDFPKELGAFLETATEGNLPAETAEQVLMAHEQDVLDVVSSYMDEDYEMAYQTYDEGFKRMSTIGTALSGAIATQMPDKFSSEVMPETMPDTGMGGTASNSMSMWVWMAAAVLAVGGAFAVARKKTNA
ncbi:copper amine oxidase [Halobacillus sp. ACCC02827]|uniref:hypothetical protein n=1 Tax=unclassified Halobacillus TaxID=2636472 RepID=UPI000782D704|nr:MULTISPECIES: hypothetical protein [unclassified Halobacillus]WJE15039.1 copper amine oxidase [Halobacillus sp. ACCC02827]